MKEIERKQYLEELDRWRDNPDIVKVILGVRRAGKSVVMDQYMRRIIESGVDPKDILFMDFESSDYDDIENHRSLNAYIAERLSRSGRTYVFMDEVQRVDGWERLVNSDRKSVV